jgi:hypothetical protein
MALGEQRPTPSSYSPPATPHALRTRRCARAQATYSGIQRRRPCRDRPQRTRLVRTRGRTRSLGGRPRQGRDRANGEDRPTRKSAPTPAPCAATSRSSCGWCRARSAVGVDCAANRTRTCDPVIANGVSALLARHPEHCKPVSDTGVSNRPPAIPNYHPIGSRTSGNDVAAQLFGVRSQVSFVDADSLLTHNKPLEDHQTSGPAQNAGPFFLPLAVAA